MEDLRPGSVRLSERSEVVSDMDREDLLEAAALGSIVDWELVKFLARTGWVLVSLSFRFKEAEVLMVLKVRVNEAQYVVFVTSSSPRGCMSTLVRKMDANAVALYPDKYS